MDVFDWIDTLIQTDPEGYGMDPVDGITECFYFEEKNNNDRVYE